MKLYSLLILTKIRKKAKNNFKAQKKSERVRFPGYILPCKQNKFFFTTTTRPTTTNVLCLSQVIYEAP